MPTRSVVVASALSLALAGLGACGSADDDLDGDSSDNGGNPGQGWSDAEREAFYTTSHGGQLIPRAWFVALEAPGQTALLTSPEVAGSLGLVAEPGRELPIGMTVYTDPIRGEMVGFGCAACHTQQLDFDGERLRIEGGAGYTDSVSVFFAIFDGVIETADDPERYDRFEARVLDGLSGEQAEQAAEQLRVAFTATADLFRAQVVGIRALTTVTPGFGRLDAFNFVHNAMFGAIDPANVRPADGPLSVPSLWGSGSFDWTHYTASTRMRFSRDVLNAMGAGARFTIVDGVATDSSVPLLAIVDQEQRIDMLEAPRWPGERSAKAAKRGKALYQRDCAGCHDGTLEDGVLIQELVDVDEIGTDPNYAAAVSTRVIANTGPMGLGENVPAIELSAAFTQPVIDAESDKLGLSEAERLEMAEGRPNQWRGLNAYKALPLAGVWATPPYLHNGSVPTLHDLLLPPGERPGSFELAPVPIYDSERLGLALDQPGDGFTFDTTLAGNHNTGHDYGTDLSDSERADLLEYLKTL